MSTFFVGQKVKKVRGESALGITATVTAIPSTMRGDLSHCIDVILDAPAINQRGQFFVAGEETATPPELWEPIIPDGLESLEEINRLWQAEPETVRA